MENLEIEKMYLLMLTVSVWLPAVVFATAKLSRLRGKARRSYTGK